MTLTDRIFIALVLTLALFALFIERNKWRKLLTADVAPPTARRWLLARSNVPLRRGAEVCVDDVGYMDVTDAAGKEPIT
jgi:hypothetical protein